MRRRLTPDICEAARRLGWVVPTREEEVREAEREVEANPVELPATLQNAKEVFQRADRPTEGRIAALGGQQRPASGGHAGARRSRTWASHARNPRSHAPRPEGRRGETGRGRSDKDRHGKDVR